MKVLITGAGGYVGKLLVQFLVNQKYEIYALYNRQLPDYMASIPEVNWIQSKLGFNTIDLDPVDVIIHAATVQPLSKTPPSPIDYLDSNINATRKLLDYGVSCSSQLFIYLSTVTIHGHVEVKELDENTPQIDPNLYGISKFMAERIIETYANRIPSVILRLPGIIGPELLILGRPWLCTILKKAISNKPISIFNANSLFNNVTDIYDLTDLIGLLINEWNSGVEIFNLAGSEPIKIKNVVKNIINQTQSSSEIIEENNNSNSFYIKIDKIINQLQFRPKTTEAMIRHFVKDNPLKS